MSNNSSRPENNSGASRRDFLKAGTVAGVTGSLLGSFAANSQVFAAGDDILKVGLIGCGGRGTGAANQALNADKKAHLVAVGDAFPEAIEPSLNSLRAQKEIADQVKVDDDHKFSGLDSYRHVIDASDVVILASPPGFRPEHLAYAVEKGKHIFTEKPMATDGPGIRSVIESVKKAKEKNLSLVAGYCWRYDYPRRALFQKVLAGEIGDVLCTYATYLTGSVKPMQDPASRPEGMSDLEWEVRNWYNFTWLSGDGLVEQAIHAVDWLAWAKGDQAPVSCTAVGGRQTPAVGTANIFDHIEVNYLWADDTRSFLAQRQINGCYNDNSCYILGSKGKGEIGRRGVSIKGESNWKYEGPNPNMYQVEHDELFASIRNGKPINDGDRMVNSTLMGIMGRMAGYTGKEVTYEEALNSKEILVPETPNWDTKINTPGIAIPGVNQFE
ncbi:Gfo/Idh/MocA family protein [Planctomicrobium sp. SH668]|uniref:Gfo/Idh/MocA family protein n=1 Tax=Planctomicrobium sp. SH668 TaxID=3448126 RepID=UPI003F5BE739